MKLRLPHKFQAALLAALASVSFTTLSSATAFATTLEDAALGLDDFTTASVQAAQTDGWRLSNISGSDTGVYTTTTSQARIDKNGESWATQSGDRCLWSAVVTFDINTLPTNTTGTLIEAVKSFGTTANADFLEGIGYDSNGNVKLEGAWNNGAYSGLTTTSDLRSYADANGLVTVGLTYHSGNDGTAVYVWDQRTQVGGLRSTNKVGGNLVLVLANKGNVEISNLYLFGNTVDTTDMQSMMKDAGAYYWTGSTDGNWNAATTNWTHYGSSVAVAIGTNGGNAHTNVVFGADATQKTVTLAGATTVGALTVSGDDYTFSLSGDSASLSASAIEIASGSSLTVNGGVVTAGSLSGAGSLIKTGDGTMTVNGNNTGYTGNVTISGGTLKVGNNRALGNMNGSNAIKIVTGGTLDVNGQEGVASNTYVVELAGGKLTNSGGGLGSSKRQFVTSVKVTNDSEINASSEFGFTGGNYDPITVTFENGAVLEKTGSNTFWVSKADVSGAGSFKVSEGTLYFQKDGSYASNIEMAGGTVAGALKLDGVIGVNTTENSTFSATVNTNTHGINYSGTANLNVTGVISGSGSLTKNGTGTVTLSGNNTYTGDTTVSQGTLAILGHNNLGASDITVASGATLSLQADNCLTTTGTLTFETGATLDLSHYSGTISTTPTTVASATGGITGFGEGMYIAPTAPKGMEASVTLGGTDKNEILVSYSVKEGAVMHVYILTGQSNSLGAVKDMPLPTGMQAAYNPIGVMMYNANITKYSSASEITNAETNPQWVQLAPQKPVYNGNLCMGPEYGFAYVMNQHPEWYLGEGETEGSLGVVLASLDGGGNSYWDKSNTSKNYTYANILQNIENALQAAAEKGYSKVSLDGLMYLQGESNKNSGNANAADTMYQDFIRNLKGDLTDWLATKEWNIEFEFDSNHVAGEPATWTLDGIEPSTEGGTITANKLLGIATQEGKINVDGNGMGFVYTRDLAKTNVDGQKVHYRGTAQLTIGARYAYAFAVQNGVNVGAVRGQDDSATLDTGAAWWMEITPTENDIAVWDISSVSQSIPIPECNKIADGKTLTVGGIRIEDVYNPNATEPGYGSVGITGGTIQIGKAGLKGSGITLVGADLSISSAVQAVANQTWSAQNGHKLAVNGTTTISTGATLTFADDLYLTFGAITGTGNLAIGKVTFDMGLDYMLANAMGEYVSSAGAGENGFFSGNLNLVKLTGANSQITFTGAGGGIANITKAGELANYELALSSDNKALQLTGLQPESTVYYARSGAVTYTDTDTEEYGIYTAAQVALAGSATHPAVLTLASELKSGVTIKSEGLGGTINIASGIELAQGSVNASGAPVVLAGEGTFVMTPKSGDVNWPMPINVNLATGENGWKGVVRISGGNFKANNLDALANGQYSTIELNGVSGWTGYSTGTLALNLKLTNSASASAWRMNAGSSTVSSYDTAPNMTLSGTISGIGDLEKADGYSQNFTFTGDISGWTGKFIQNSSGTRFTRLTFSGNANTVNVDTLNNSASSKLGIAVGNGTAAFSTTFTEQSSIQGLDELLVRANATAVFAGGLTTASTTLNAGSTLSITGSGQTYNLGTVNTGTGTLDLVTSVSTGNMTVGGTLKLAGAGEGMLTVGGLLTLQANSTLDLARIFKTPVQNAPLRSNASPQLFSALGGGSSTLSLNDNLDGASLPQFGAVTPAAGDTYILATADDISLAGGVQLENIAPGFSGKLSKKAADSGYNLVLTLAALPKIWDNSTGNGQWDVETSDNWHVSGDTQTGTARFSQNDSVTFTSGNWTAALQQAITADTVTLESGANVTVSGSSYKLTVNDIDAAGATLTLSTSSAQINDAAVVGALNGSAALELANGSSLTVSGDNSSAYSGVISGSGSLTKDGDGTLTLSGANTFSGDLTISHGVVKMGNNRALGQLNNVSSVTRTIQVNAGGTLDYSGTEGGENGYKVTLNGGTLTNTGIGRGSNVRQVVTSLVLQADSTIDAASNMGIIANGYGATTISLGDYTLEKTGTNNLYLNNTAITGGGSIKVSAGSVVFNDRSSDSQLGSLSSNLELAGGNIAGTINLGGDITVTSSGNGGSINADIKGSSKITKTGDVALTMSGNYNNYTGTLDNASSAAISMTLNGSQTTMGITSTGGGAVNLTLNAADYTLNGNQQVNDIGQKTSWSAYIGGSGNVTATGTVRTGRLVVGNMDSDSNAVFTLSGPGAMLNQSDGSHIYGAKVQGYGTFALANGATQTLSGNLAEYNGTFKATGTGSVLTLSNPLGSGADLLAENGGKIVLTSSVTSVDAVTVDDSSTLTLSGAITPLSTTGTFSLAGGSTLDLSNYTYFGADPVILVTTTGGGTISGPEDWSSVHLTFASGTAPENARLDVQNGNLVLTFAQPEPGKNLIWDGGSDTWDAGTTALWHEAESTDLITFTNHDNAIFDSASSDATVTVSGAVTAGSVAVEDGANVTIVTGNGNTLGATSGITVDGTLVLDGTSISGTLSGDGVVVGNEIPSAANWSKSAVLGDLSLDTAHWTGTVEVAGGNSTYDAPYVVLDTINQLGTADSTVRLKGVGGYFNGSNISVGIELVNPDDASPAVLVTAGNNKTTTFSGNISGSGDLVFNKFGGSQETYKFTGDIAGWKGSLSTLDQANSNRNGTLNVELAESADEVNASIIQGGTKRALNLKVNNDATFNNTVKVSNVEIAGSEASATFLGDTQINTLAGAGTLVVDGANTTTTIGSGTDFSGAIDLLGGTLNLTNALTGVGAVNLGTGTTAATLKLAAGGNALGSNSTITLGNNLTFDLSNYNSYTLDQPVTLATATGFSGDAGSVSLTGLTLEEGYTAKLSVVDTNLVLTVKDESEQLYWLDPSGTWGARHAWYQQNQTTQDTFQNGDSVTIVGNNYDGGISTTINMTADASARKMTVTKDKSVTATTVTIKDTVNENRLAAKTLVVDDDVTLVANTQLEVTETAQLGTNSKLELNSKKDATIAAAISSNDDNTAVITKQGGNTLTLTGNNSEYTGSINVTAGTLAAQSANALGGADVTVSGGAKLSLENRAAMSAGSLTLNSGSTISFLGDSVLNLAGTLTLGDGVTWDLSRYGFDRPAQGETGTATLINVAGFSGALGANPVITVPGIVDNAQLKYENGSVILTYTMDPQGNLYWKGGVGTWNTNADNASWYPMKTGGDLTSFYSGDNVTFDARAAVSSVTLTEDITAGTVTVENGTRVTLQDGTGNATLAADQIDIAGTLGTNVNVAKGTTVNIAETGMWIVSGDKDREFAGEIVSSVDPETGAKGGTLSMAGAGDLLLSGDNSGFTGEIQLNSGSITAANANALGTDTTIVMGDGTELKGSGTIAAVNVNDTTFNTLKDANSAISANLKIVDGSVLTIAGDGATTLSGSISGSGDLYKTGFGTTVMSGDMTYTGSTTVGQGSLVLGKAYGLAGDFTVGIGSSLTLSGAYTAGSTSLQPESGLYVGGTFAMNDGSILDMSNIEFKNGIAELVNADKLDVLKTDVSYGGGTVYHMVEGISLVNLQLPETTYARLMYKKDGNREVLYATTLMDDNGYYWNGATEGDNIGDGTWYQTGGGTANWHNSAGTPAEYTTSSQNPHAAYFLKLDGVDGAATVTMPEDIMNTGSIIFGEDARYVLNAKGEYGSLAMDTGSLTGLILRQGSDVVFNAYVGQGDGSYFLVEEGAHLVIDASRVSFPDASLYNGENHGSIELHGVMSTLKHVANFNNLHVNAYVGEYGSGALQIGTLYNAVGATTTLTSESVTALLVPQRNEINNDGTLNIVTPDESDMVVGLPIVGAGDVYTDGTHELTFSYSLATDWSTGSKVLVPVYATVESSNLDMNAASTVYEFAVDISNKTTLESGKQSYMYGGAQLEELELKSADGAIETAFHVGPEHVIESFDEDGNVIYSGYAKQDYDVGAMVSEGGSVLYVDKGADMTIASINAGQTLGVGSVTVGAGYEAGDERNELSASLEVAGVANVDTMTVLSGSATITGNASINQIMQDDGVLTLNANSVLNGVPVSAEPDAALTGGTVTGGVLVLAGGKTLDQNAVIDVRTAAGSETEGTYTVSGGEGSRIDASDLELTVNHDKTFYREVGKEQGSVIIKDETTQTQSGFMASGEEFVKLFDMASGTTLTAKSEGSPQGEAVYHASASGMMTLIGTDNYEDLEVDGGSKLAGYIGYGYLFTKNLALKTYYVRDTYTEADQKHQLAADRVTLTDILAAATPKDQPESLLENVVFDKTAYNTGFSPYNGTLTVDEDTSVDLFSVSDGTKAAINIVYGITVTANDASPGVAGSLDLEGEGVYEITNRNDLGQNIAVRDESNPDTKDWDGTVRVTGTSTDLNIDNMYADKDGEASTIEFQNWNGALKGGTHENNAKIVLTAPTAMKLTGEDDIAYTFTNTVSGGGNINHAEGGNVAMTFEGNTSGWNGTYEQLSDTKDSLTFTGGETVSANVISGNGSMDLTYGGSVETVAGGVNVYSGGDTPTTMNVTYTGADKAVTGGITSDAQSNLTLTVGDGKQATNATFTGTFAGTENATMAVQSGSTATIGTHAALQRVVGEAGSNVVVNSDSTLSLTSMDPKNGYSEFHNLSNAGTIEMKASGGDIRLVNDTTGDKAFNLGDLKLTDPVGTATIETYGVAGKTTNVNLSGLQGPASASQVLKLTNGNATGTVNYNLSNSDDDHTITGTIAYGVNGGNGAVTNLVLQENGKGAANAVLQTSFANADDAAAANIVVDAAEAQVLGLSSDANSYTAHKDMVVSGSSAGDTNKTLKITGDGEYNYAGKLGANLDVAYTGEGMQVINGGVEGFKGKVTVDNGSTAAGVLAILNAARVDITDLTIGANDRLSVADGTAVVSHSVLATGGPTIEGNGSASTLEGSLTLSSGSTYDVSAAGGIGGLNLTGALTIYEGAQLSSSDISTLWGLEIGGSYDLAFGVVDVNFGDDVVTKDDQIDASRYFTNLYPGEFYICYTGVSGSEGSAGSNVGTVYLYKATPEPTTSTLSLLALAALAARRRRK